MLESPHVLKVPARVAAVIPITIPRAQIREVMGPGFGELIAALKAQGIAPAGPWFSHHLRLDPDTFDFELGIPIDQPITPNGRVRPGQLPAAKVARVIYRGPYETLGAAWGEFQNWIQDQGHTPAADFWESYLSGPESGDNPTTYRTELNRVLLDPA